MCDQLKFVDTKEDEIKARNVMESFSADERQKESGEGEKSENGGKRQRHREAERTVLMVIYSKVDANSFQLHSCPPIFSPLYV